MAVPWRSRRRSAAAEPRTIEPAGLDAPSWVQPLAPDHAPPRGAFSGDFRDDDERLRVEAIEDRAAQDRADRDRADRDRADRDRAAQESGAHERDTDEPGDAESFSPDHATGEYSDEAGTHPDSGEQDDTGLEGVPAGEVEPDAGSVYEQVEAADGDAGLEGSGRPEAGVADSEVSIDHDHGGDVSGSEEPAASAGVVTDVPEDADGEAEHDDREAGAMAMHEAEPVDDGPRPGTAENAPGHEGTAVDVPAVEGEVVVTETTVKTIGPTDGPILDPETLPTAGPNSTMPMVLPRVLAIANQKGGVGKTTTAVNLGAALAELGYRVMIVDLDPQGNATTGLGVNPRDVSGSIYDVMLNDVPLEDVIEPTTLRNLFVAPATIDLAGAEIELVPVMSREYKLKKAIDSVRDDYDIVLIDCPPSLGLLTVNGLAAADDVIVPIQCEYYALEGLGQLLRNVGLVQTNLNQGLDVRGIILTMYDARTRLADQVEAEVRNYFGAKVYRTVVPRTVRLSEAPSFGQPIIVFDSTSRGAQAYRELAKEVSRGATRRAG